MFLLFLHYFINILLFPCLLLAILFVIKVIFFMHTEGVQGVDALFWSVNPSALAAGAKNASTKLLSSIFTIAQWILCVWIAERVVLSFVKGHGWGVLKGMRNEARIKRLKDHIIICGYGQMGRAVAEECQRAKTPFLIIEKQEGLAKQLLEDGICTICGDAKRRGVLLASGIKRAKAVLILIDDDAENLYITVTAKSLNPKVLIVTRAGKARYAHVLRSGGADYVIVPEQVAAQHIWGMLTRKA
jgi:voltage-gated potassium channel